MRALTISVRNNQEIELFVKKNPDGFELWSVGKIKGKRVVIDHHLTHDDLEARLEYAGPGDLTWHDAVPSEIPSEKYAKAIEQEETIARGVFWDYERRTAGGIQTVTCHLGAIGFLTVDKGELISAKKMMLGKWTDSILTFNLKANNELEWICTKKEHWLNRGERVHGHAPDWWSFATWRMGILNQEFSCGTHVGILRVDKHELHLEGGGHLHRMAYIFHRT